MADDDRGAVAGVERPSGVGTDETAASAPSAARVPGEQVFRWAATGPLGVLVILLAAYGIYVVRRILVLVVIDSVRAAAGGNGGDHGLHPDNRSDRGDGAGRHVIAARDQ